MTTSAGSLSVFAMEAPLVDRSKDWMASKEKTSVHTFQAAEVRALYLACEKDLERLLLTALFSTGMRIGGFCLALREGAIMGTSSNPIIGDRLVTNEKGNRVREYRITPALKFLLHRWASSEGCGQRYLFPNSPGGNMPWNTRRAREMFMNIANRAGVKGSHVKPHTTRHTVCWTLSALGNTMDSVSKFAGHRSSDVTRNVYVAMEEALNESCMNTPWTDLDGESGKKQLIRTAIELASAIASPFTSSDMQTFPDYSHLLNSMRTSSGSSQNNRNVHFEHSATVASEESHQKMSALSNRKAERKAVRREKAASFLEQSENDRKKNAILMERLASRKPVVVHMCIS